MGIEAQQDSSITMVGMSWWDGCELKGRKFSRCRS